MGTPGCSERFHAAAIGAPLLAQTVGPHPRNVPRLTRRSRCVCVVHNFVPTAKIVCVGIERAHCSDEHDSLTKIYRAVQP